VSDIIENAAALTARARSNVIISGLDEYTRDYEQQIRNEAERLVSRIDRFQGLQADYVSLNIRRHRERNYEAHARLSLKQRGTVFAHAYGYSVESVVSSLIESIYDRVRERKEEFISNKRGADRYYGEEQ
jgi:ribonucleotide reductase beta subunit family protein with ferritin-like domain